MKDLLTGMGLAAAGLTVFGGSVVGLLAIQGRLQSGDVNDVPILNQIVEEPAAPGTAGDVGTANASLQMPAQEPGGTVTRGGEEPERAPGSRAVPIAARTGEMTNPEKLFTLQGFEAPTDRDELARFYDETKRMRERLEREYAVMEQRRFEMQLREQDLEERRRSVDSLMAKVETGIQDIDAKKQQFEQDVTVFKESEKKRIKSEAGKLDLMQPQAASDYLLQLCPEKEELAVKLFVSMDPEAASKVLELMDRVRGARLIEKATRVIDRK